MTKVSVQCCSCLSLVHRRTFVELVFLQAVIVEKHSAVALKLLALRRRPQLCHASLGQRPLLLARSPANEGETKFNVIF